MVQITRNAYVDLLLIYCFPNLLFTKGKYTIWTTAGVSNLVHHNKKFKKHASVSHLNVFQFIST